MAQKIGGQQLRFGENNNFVLEKTCPEKYAKSEKSGFVS